MEKTKLHNAKYLLATLAFMFIAFIGSSTAYAGTSVSPGNSYEKATSIKLDTVYDATFADIDDSHYYKFTLSKDTFVQFEFTGISDELSDFHFYMCSWDIDNDEEIAEYYNTYIETQNGADKTHFVSLKKGTYYVDLSHNYGSIYDYNYTMRINTHTDNGTKEFKNINGTKEHEYNDDIDCANKIKLGSVVYGMSSLDDLDMYKITVEETGYLELEFEADVLNKQVTCDEYSFGVEIMDKEYPGQTNTIMSHSGTKSLKNTSMKVGVKKGTYYVYVYRYTNKKNLDKDTIYVYDNIYGLKVNFKKSNDYEIETNDDFDNPNPISLGKTYNGYLDESDIDWYSFEVKKDGYIEVDLKFDAEKTEETYNMEIYTPSHHPMHSIENIPITNGKSETKVFGLKKGKYCIKLDNWISSTDNNYPYKLTITQSKKNNSTNGELEDNNSKETANSIRIGKEMSGATWGRLDKCDVYKFSVKSDTFINFTVDYEKSEREEATKDKLWNISIRDEKAKVIVDKTMYANETSVTSGTRKLSKGTYYVTVDQKMDNYTEYKYKLTLNKVTLKAPTISKVTSKSYNQMELKWKKVSGVSKYEIYRATSKNGKYKKVKTITNPKTTSWTDKKVKTGKTYYYKMKSVIKTTKDEKSSFSKVKSAKCTPSAPKVSLSTSTKQAKVTWKKVSGATGYEVYRSTSKDGKYKKVKTIKNSKTVSYKDKKVTSGKKYYYKVRTYKTVSGKKVYSNYSSVKSIKVK